MEELVLFRISNFLVFLSVHFSVEKLSEEPSFTLHAHMAAAQTLNCHFWHVDTACDPTPVQCECISVQRSAEYVQ